MRLTLLFAIGALACTCALGQEAAKDDDPKPLTDKKYEWKDFLTDTSSGAVTASGMLGISGENVTSIENVRSLVVALPSLGSSDSDQTIGLSITPARTGITPMNLQSYADSFAMRLLGSLTLSYARGPTEIEGVEYDREAYAIDTNAFFDDDDDVIIAYAKAFKTDASCRQILQAEKPADPPTAGVPSPAVPEAPATLAGPAASATPAAAPATSGETAETPGSVVPKEAPADHAVAVKKRAAACKEKITKSVTSRWNRSQLSLSYGDARIRIKDNTKSRESLGRTFAVSVVYGFGNSKEKSGSFAVTANYRRTEKEPVLNTLAAAQTVFKDSSLLVAQLKFGNDTSRVFAEFSDARSHDITASQRAFKRALGIDVRAFEGTWLNLRIGKQRRVDGTDDETGSLLSITYSPKALL